MPIFDSLVSDFDITTEIDPPSPAAAGLRRDEFRNEIRNVEAR